MRYFGTIKRGQYVTKSSILTKQIMLGVIGWQYTGKSCVEHKVPRKNSKWKYVARDLNGERVVIGETMQEAEEFCLNKYKEFYDTHPEERDWLPDPYNRKKAISKVIIIKERENEKCQIN